MLDFAYFIQSYLETFGIVALSLALASVPIKVKKVTIISLIVTITNISIRALPLTLGIHLVAGMLLIFLFFLRKTNVSAPKSFVVIFMSVFALGIIEFITHEILLSFTGLTFQDIAKNLVVWNLLGLSQAILINIAAFVIPIFLKPCKGLWK
jgi:hypothetical protein